MGGRSESKDRRQMSATGVDCSLMRALAKGVASRADEFLLRKNGSAVQVEYAIAPIRLEDEFIGSIINFRESQGVRALEKSDFAKAE